MAKTSGPAVLRWLVNAYIKLIRNTSFLVQLFFFFFALPRSACAGPPDRFFTQPRDERTRQFLGQILSAHPPHHAQAKPPQPVQLPQQPILP
jgi:ABC-type amino acid transport system permease subunit